MTNRRRITTLHAPGFADGASSTDRDLGLGEGLLRGSVAEHARKGGGRSGAGRSRGGDSTEGTSSRGASAASTDSQLSSGKASRTKRGGGRAGRGAQREGREGGLFSDAEIKELQSEYADGLTAVQIVELFASRGIRFSEATFRKYVQQGLLPRSRRVGRKGKHRGSLGVYPAKVVQRINLIKTLMDEGYTIEEIQSQFLHFTDAIERIEEGIADTLELFRGDVDSPRFDARARKSIEKDIADAETCAEELLGRINDLSERLSQSHEDSYRSSSAAGSAEDLLSP